MNGAILAAKPLHVSLATPKNRNNNGRNGRQQGGRFNRRQGRQQQPGRIGYGGSCQQN